MSVMRIGGFLVLVGLIVAVLTWGDPSSVWSLVPAGLLAVGIGVIVAGLVSAQHTRRARSRGKSAALVTRRPSGGPVRRIRSVPVLIADSWRGRTAVPRFQLLLWLVAVVYLVSPVDFAADIVLPALGIPGGIGLAVWLVTSVYAETGYYLAERDLEACDAHESG